MQPCLRDDRASESVPLSPGTGSGLGEDRGGNSHPSHPVRGSTMATRNIPALWLNALGRARRPHHTDAVPIRIVVPVGPPANAVAGADPFGNRPRYPVTKVSAGAVPHEVIPARWRRAH